MRKFHNTKLTRILLQDDNNVNKNLSLYTVIMYVFLYKLSLRNVSYDGAKSTFIKYKFLQLNKNMILTIIYYVIM